MTLIRLSLALSVALGVLGARDCRGAAPRPNILLIMCDDLGWSDIGCYGGEIDTPHLDRLAAEGMRFTHFYNNAKCTTTRASIITGLYPRSQGEDRWRQFLRPEMVTLGEALRAAGYSTALVGKWHLGRDTLTHPARRGFDDYYGLLDGASNHFNPSMVDPPYKGSRRRYFADNFTQITEFSSDFYTTDAFTDRAVENIRKFSAREQPFFVHVCYTAPHYPLHAREEDVQKYVGRYREGWHVIRQKRYKRQIEMGLIDSRFPLSPEDSRAYEWDQADHEFEDRRMAVYAAMVDRMDQGIGRLLTELDRAGVRDNTLVIFLSDNGGCAEEPGGRDPAVRRPGPKDDYVAVGPSWGWAQNTPFRRYKVWMHEGGIATPMIARWPSTIAAGVISDQVGHIIDFMPTFLELAGGEYPKSNHKLPTPPLEGGSLAPVFQGERREPPQLLAWEFSGNAAVRIGDWKAVWDKLVKRWELYDLAEDRTEITDLADQHPDKLRSLAAAYNHWALATENTTRPLP